MAQLKTTSINGNLNVSDRIYGGIIETNKEFSCAHSSASYWRFGEATGDTGNDYFSFWQSTSGVGVKFSKYGIAYCRGVSAGANCKVGDNCGYSFTVPGAKECYLYNPSKANEAGLWLKYNQNNTDKWVDVVKSLTSGTSDIRLKTAIKPTKVKALEKIQKMEVKEFIRTDENKFYSIGFIADELEKVDSNLTTGGVH